MQENRKLKSSKQLLSGFKARITLENLEKSDPKLAVLIKKIQIAENENSKLKSEISPMNKKKAELTSEYFSITCRFLEDEKIKQRIRELESYCIEKTGNIEKLSNVLAGVKMKLNQPRREEDIKRLNELYEELKLERKELRDFVQRFKEEYEIVCSLIACYASSPKKRCVSADKLKEHIKVKTCRNLELDRRIKEKESYRNNVKGIVDKASSRDPSLAETERKYIKVKASQEPKQHLVLSAKSHSKPGTPLASKLLEFNRGFFKYN